MTRSTPGDSGGPSVETVRLLPGRTIPNTRYRILRWLGEGGMGVVYEAEHIDLGRRVAVKLLRIPQHLDEEAAQSFRDEARTASGIGSEHIVDVFDFGELPDGRLMYAMELVKGRSVADLLDEGPISTERLIPIFRQVCKGLAAAHAAGVVHCDIKPENILLTSRGSREDHVKIVDFGISKIQTNEATPTFNGSGTPPYMAPEQCLGTRYDGRLDMYALGCTVYEMLVGHPPFPDLDTHELLHAHVEQPPEPPSQAQKSSGFDAAPIPRPMEAIVLDCLAKHAEDRFKDMADLEAAICEAQIALGIETPWDDLELPDVDPERRAKLLASMPSFDTVEPRAWWKIPSLVAAAAVLLIAGIVLFTRPGEPDEAQLSQLEALTYNARTAASRAYFVYPPIDDPKGATAYTVVRQIEDLENDDASIDEDRSVELRSEFASTLTRLGDRYWNEEGGRGFAMDYYAQALLFDQASENARERAGVLPGELARLRELAEQGGFSPQELRAARALVILAEDDEAKKLEQLAALENEEETGLSPTHQARLYALSGVKRKPAKSTKPIAARPTAAKPARVDTPPEADPVTPTATPVADPGVGEAAARNKNLAKELASDGQKALRSGRTKEAETLFHRALASDSRNARALGGLSDIAFDRAQYKKATGYGEKAVRYRPKNGAYRITLGDAYFKLFRYQDAKRQYQEAKKLGHGDAAGRLKKVDAKLGK